MAFPREQIGSLVDPVTTWSPTRDAVGQIIHYVDLGSVDNNTKTITAYQTIQASDAPSRARQLIRQSDVLVSTVRPNLNGVARVPTELDGATASTGFCVLRSNAKLDANYLFQWVRTPAFVAAMIARASGQSYPAVSDRIIFNSEIPLPPLKEQQHIAAVLDRIDTLATDARAVLASIKSLEWAYFLEVFGDLSRFPQVEMGDIMESQRIGLVRGAGEFGKGLSHPYIRMDAITRDGEILKETIQTTNATPVELRTYSLSDGDFLFNTRNSRELVGKAAVWRGGVGYLFNNNLMRLRFTPALKTDFVHFAFRSSNVRRHLEMRKTGTTSVFAIYWGDLKTLPLPVPPMRLQVTFEEILLQTSKLKAAARMRMAHFDTLFASLQQRAFAGELTRAFGQVPEHA